MKASNSPPRPLTCDDSENVPVDVKSRGLLRFYHVSRLAPPLDLTIGAVAKRVRHRQNDQTMDKKKLDLLCSEVLGARD